ncbi:MAG TPA: DASH family cryptochrome [Saprospiraceae bacterium]|nr:DASH family cryptochrome [Saprospiraceae bacterium]
MIRSILWFRQDLRLHDNEALVEAVRNNDELVPVYIFNPDQFVAFTEYGTPKTGMARTTFLVEAVKDLRQQLIALGSNLVVRIGKPEEVLFDLASQHKAHYIYCNRERTREEVEVQDKLEKKLWAIGREVRYSRGKMLYYTSDLPFPVTHCPDSFAIFKKETEQSIPVRTPLENVSSISVFPAEIEPGEIPDSLSLLQDSVPFQDKYFTGGETAGLIALKEGVNLPSTFLANPITILSPWIAMGCLSPKKVYYDASCFEKGIDEVQQHLLFRDYLRLMGKKYGDQIFYKSGIKKVQLKSKTDPNLLQRWQEGKTGVDIIDAGMRQLNLAGWLPDALRRLVSGYFIKVLNLDWRLGAAYFEAKLIDYDPCTNWVSWLNMAGLGPDTREDRIINYEAVGKKMDPEGIYINAWIKQRSA